MGRPLSPPNLHCTLYIVHFTLYIVHFTLYIVHCTRTIHHTIHQVIHQVYMHNTDLPWLVYIIHCYMYVVYSVILSNLPWLWLVHTTHCTNSTNSSVAAVHFKHALFSRRCIFYFFFFKNVNFSGFVMLLRARVLHIDNHKIEEGHRRKGSFQKTHLSVFHWF